MTEIFLYAYQSNRASWISRSVCAVLEPSVVYLLSLRQLLVFSITLCNFWHLDQASQFHSFLSPLESSWVHYFRFSWEGDQNKKVSWEHDSCDRLDRPMRFFYHTPSALKRRRRFVWYILLGLARSHHSRVNQRKAYKSSPVLVQWLLAITVSCAATNQAWTLPK